MSRSVLSIAFSSILALIGWGLFLYEQNNHSISKQENIKLVSNKLSLSKQIETLKLQTTTINQKNKLLTLNINNAKSEISSLEENKQKLIKNKDQLKKQYSALELSSRSKIKKIEATNSSLAIELEQELGSKNKLSSQVQELQYTETNLNSKLNNLNQEFVKLKQQLSEEELSRENLTNELNEQQNKLFKVHQKMDNLMANREHLKIKLKNNSISKLKLGELEQLLKLADINIDKQNTNLIEAERKVASHVEELREINQQSEDLNHQVSDLIQQTQQLEVEKITAVMEIKTLKLKLKKVIDKKEIEITKLRDSVMRISIGSDIAYYPSSTSLTQEGTKILDKVAKVMKHYPDRVISLEGHSDTVPIAEDYTDLFSSNWELSAMRAL